jgi:hypothetical protein
MDSEVKMSDLTALLWRDTRRVEACMGALKDKIKFGKAEEAKHQVREAMVHINHLEQWVRLWVEGDQGGKVKADG